MTLATFAPSRGRAETALTDRSNRIAGSTILRLTLFVGYFALHATLAVDAQVVWLAIPSWLVCCYNVARIKGPYATVEDMAWLTLFVVFVIAPCQSLRFGYLEVDGPASGIFFTDDEITTSFAIIFLFLLTATVTNVLVQKSVRAAQPARYAMSDRSLHILLALNLVAFVAYVVSEGGMGNVLADRHSKQLSDDATSSLVLTVAMAAQMVTCLLICVYARCKPQRTLRDRILVRATAAVALALLLLCQNPFNTARFFLLIGWMPIILVFVSGRIGIKTFYLGVMFGLVVAMPILNQTSRFGTSLLEAAESIDLSSAFIIPGLDVFDMLIYEVRYLQDADFFWGGKTLGLLLFFVPRTIWTGKETVLASDMGVVLEDLGVAGTPNLSGFVAGDFYADLGMAGVVIGAVLVSFVLTYFGTKRAVLVHGFDLRAAIFMASLPILIRGALGSVLALTFLELTILAVLTRVLCRDVRFRSRGAMSCCG